MTILHADWETKGIVDLKEVGLDNYARHPATSPLMLGWAFDDDEVQQWFPEDGPLPREVTDALKKGCPLAAWNAAFEWYILLEKMSINVPFEQIIDAMAWARNLSLPGSLEDAGDALGLPADKSKMAEGKKLIKFFCTPLRMGGEETLFGITEPEFRNPRNHPAEWETFKTYNKFDIVAEREILHRITKICRLSDYEQTVWELDQKINREGIPTNMDFGGKLLALAEHDKSELKAELKLRTGLANPNSTKQLLPWLVAAGYPHKSLGKDFVTLAIDNPQVPEACREILKIRRNASKTSYTKLEALNKIVSGDGRLRNQFKFMGASRSGRWAGGGVQFQNLPRPIKAVKKNLDLAISMVEKMQFDEIQKKFDTVIGTATSCVRSAFEAGPDEILDVCDLGAIENRVLGWTGQCDAISDVFRKGLDPYVDFSTKINPTRTYEDLLHDDEARQIAKPATLGAGYGLGPGVERSAYPDKNGRYAYTIIWGKDKHGNIVKTGLLAYAENMGVKMTPEQAYVAWEVFKNAYPEITGRDGFWKRLERAAIEIINNGGRQDVGFVWFDRLVYEGQCIMRLHLPSGRAIHYMNARTERKIVNKPGRRPWETTAILYDGIGHGVGAVETGWGTVYTYGGKLCENLTQAIARDILAYAMVLFDSMGGKIVAHVHDEIVALRNIYDLSAPTLADLQWCMRQTPWWAPGLLIDAKGYSERRYKKD